MASRKIGGLSDLLPTNMYELEQNYSGKCFIVFMREEDLGSFKISKTKLKNRIFLYHFEMLY